MLAIVIISDNERSLIKVSDELAEFIKDIRISLKDDEDSVSGKRSSDIDIVGPTEASIYRINNIYRRVIYLKCADNDRLTDISVRCDEKFEELLREINDKTVVEIQYDFNPMRII